VSGQVVAATAVSFSDRKNPSMDGSGVAGPAVTVGVVVLGAFLLLCLTGLLLPTPRRSRIPGRRHKTLGGPPA